MKIPFVDLSAQYQSIKREIDTAIQSVINDTAFVRGKYVAEFEQRYAQACGVDHCVSCANGTDAIYITLKALGIGRGDEVITVANSWISSSETVTQVGARPVFVDIHPDYYNIDVSRIEKKITSRTKAVIAVHLFGQPADIDTIKQICDMHSLYLIEDCAQAHFAEYGGRKVGTFGIAGTFSFYPGKNLGCYGDGGAIISNDDSLALRARMFANHGSSNKHKHEFEGINSRLDGIQASILCAKLAHIHDWNEKRKEKALLYNGVLGHLDSLQVPRIHPEATHVFHLYVIRTKMREMLQNYLAEQGIATGIHYPRALPFQQAYEYLGHEPEDFPVAYEYQDQILSLPLYPEMTEEMIEQIGEHVRGALS